MNAYEILGISLEEIQSEDLFPYAIGWDCVRPHIQYLRPNEVDGKVKGVFLFRATESDESWMRAFSENPQIKYVVAERANQALLDGICALPELERLDVGGYRLTAEDISAIGSLSKLTHLSIRNAARIEDFSFLSGLESLKSLAIHGRYKTSLDLSFLGDLPSLQGLSISGQDYHKQNLYSLNPLARLTQLRYLSLVQIKPEKDGLFPVAKLSNLEYLFLIPSALKQWSIEEYRAIVGGCRKLHGKAIKLAANDPEFQKANRIK